MRIRQVRPEFWQDEEVASWPVAVRLFYVGLWGVCDDAGYFEFVPSRIAAALFPYEPRHSREAHVEKWLAALIDAGKVVRFEGCEHAVVPTLTVHQKSGGQPSCTVKKEHDVENRRTTDKSVSNVTVSRDRLGGGTGGESGPTEESAGFSGKLPPFEQIVGGRTS